MSTTIGPMPAGVRSRVDRALLAAGIAASAVYVAALVLGPVQWPGYSSLDQAVSELSAVGAPSRPLMVALLLVDSALALAFAVGVLRVAGASRGLRATGWLLSRRRGTSGGPRGHIGSGR